MLGDVIEQKVDKRWRLECPRNRVPQQILFSDFKTSNLLGKRYKVGLP